MILSSTLNTILFVAVLVLDTLLLPRHVLPNWLHHKESFWENRRCRSGSSRSSSASLRPSVRPSVHSSVRPFICPSVRLCVRKLAQFSAVVSQNVTKKSCLVCVKNEKYALWMTPPPQLDCYCRGEAEVRVLNFKTTWSEFQSPVRPLLSQTKLS